MSEEYIADEKIRMVPNEQGKGYILSNVSTGLDPSQKAYKLRELYKKLAYYYLCCKFNDCLEIIADCIDERGDLSAQVVCRSPSILNPLAIGKDTIAIVFQRHYNDMDLFKEGRFDGKIQIGHSESQS